MGRATEDLLDQLHEMQAAALRDALKDAKDNNEAPSPALLAQVNKFLKDNGIDRAIIPGDTSDILYDSMPEFDHEGNVLEFKR